MAGVERVVVLVNSLTVHGRTRLQKYGFLASKLYGGDLERLGFYSDWRPNEYGPYSSSLDLDVRQCVRDGIVDEADGPEPGGTAYHVYALRPKGLAMLRRLALEHGPIIEALSARLSDFNRKPWQTLLGDMCRAYPEYTVNNLIKDELAGISDGDDGDYEYEPNLNPEIARALVDIELGRFGGTTYTAEEYIAHVRKLLEE